jgi:hypothetical protein
MTPRVLIVLDTTEALFVDPIRIDELTLVDHLNRMKSGT